MNPFVTLDYRNHPIYSKRNDMSDLLRLWKAEVLMFNFNTGTLRVRLYDINTNECVYKNHETSSNYILENEITVKIAKA